MSVVKKPQTKKTKKKPPKTAEKKKSGKQIKKLATNKKKPAKYSFGYWRFRVNKENTS